MVSASLGELAGLDQRVQVGQKLVPEWVVAQHRGKSDTKGFQLADQLKVIGSVLPNVYLVPLNTLDQWATIRHLTLNHRGKVLEASH